MGNNPTLKRKLLSLTLPTILIYFITISVGGVFMLLYGVSIDSMLACYSMDHIISLKRERGVRKLYKTPKALRTFMSENQTKYL